MSCLSACYCGRAGYRSRNSPSLGRRCRPTPGGLCCEQWPQTSSHGSSQYRPCRAPPSCPAEESPSTRYGGSASSRSISAAISVSDMSSPRHRASIVSSDGEFSPRSSRDMNVLSRLAKTARSCWVVCLALRSRRKALPKARFLRFFLSILAGVHRPDCLNRNVAQCRTYSALRADRRKNFFRKS